MDYFRLFYLTVRFSWCKPFAVQMFWVLLAVIPFQLNGQNEKPEPVLEEGSESPPQKVQWGPLLRQSALFLGLQHGFRIATEPDTRAPLGKSVFGGYARAVGDMHGWADGDPFYVNYVGHPMQGAVAGYIFLQNDPSYRTAEFGKSPRYWKSRLRATAWSWAYSMQFEVGPFSEASIGHIQSYHPQAGFVDHVVTPVIGLGWMIGEDALDKYLVEKVERRTRNQLTLLLVRSWANPSRSMANMLRGEAPWHRDGRPRISASEYEWNRYWNRPAVIESPVAGPLQPAPFEFETRFDARRFTGSGQGRTCLGGGASGAYRVHPQWQVLVDVSGCKLMGMDANFSGDTLTYLAGMRWTPRPAGAWSPYLQLLIGGQKMTVEELFPEIKEEVDKQFADDIARGKRKDFIHSLYTEQEETNGFAVSLGGGVDYALTRGLAWRVASLQYTHAWNQPVAGASYRTSFQVNSGLILRMGTW